MKLSAGNGGGWKTRRIAERRVERFGPKALCSVFGGKSTWGVCLVSFVHGAFFCLVSFSVFFFPHREGFGQK